MHYLKTSHMFKAAFYALLCLFTFIITNFRMLDFENFGGLEKLNNRK